MSLQSTALATLQTAITFVNDSVRTTADVVKSAKLVNATIVFAGLFRDVSGSTPFQRFLSNTVKPLTCLNIVDVANNWANKYKVTTDDFGKNISVAIATVADFLRNMQDFQVVQMPAMLNHTVRNVPVLGLVANTAGAAASAFSLRKELTQAAPTVAAPTGADPTEAEKRLKKAEARLKLVKIALDVSKLAIIILGTVVALSLVSTSAGVTTTLITVSFAAALLGWVKDRASSPDCRQSVLNFLSSW